MVSRHQYGYHGGAVLVNRASCNICAQLAAATAAMAETARDTDAGRELALGQIYGLWGMLRRLSEASRAAGAATAAQIRSHGKVAVDGGGDRRAGRRQKEHRNRSATLATL